MNAQEIVISRPFQYPTAAKQIESTVALHMQKAVKAEGHRKQLPKSATTYDFYPEAKKVRNAIRQYIQANQNCTTADIQRDLGYTKDTIEPAVSHAITHRQINCRVIKGRRTLYTGAFKGPDERG